MKNKKKSMMCYFCNTNIILLSFTHFVLVKDAHKVPTENERLHAFSLQMTE